MCCVDGFQSFWACSVAKKGYSGVTTYCTTRWAPKACETDALSDTVKEPSLCGEGRLMLTDHGSFVLINVYVPNAGVDSKDRPRLEYKLRFLRALLTKCSALIGDGREVLLVGDFNVCEPCDVHPRISAPYTPEEHAALRDFYSSSTSGAGKGDFEETGRSGPFIDVWKHLHPDEEGVFTVWDEKTSARAFNEGVRIDYVFATAGIMPHVVSCEILGADVLPPKWSDHAGILLEIGDSLQPPACGTRVTCQEWTKINRRFNDPAQRSIVSMFGGKHKKEATKKRPLTEEAIEASMAPQKQGKIRATSSLPAKESRRSL